MPNRVNWVDKKVPIRPSRSWYLTLFAVVAGAILVSPDALAAVHVGEDGFRYDLAAGPDRADWLFDKVEPAVLEAAKAGKNVDVAVHVARPAPSRNAEDPVAAIKARYRPRFEALSQQMRAIWKSAAPARSLDEDEERAFMKAMGLRVSSQDRALLLDLQRQHDDLRTAMHKDVGAALHAAGLAERSEVSEFIAAAGGQVHADVAVINLVAATVFGDTILSLAKHPLVTAVVRDPETQYELDNSHVSAGYDDWHSSPDGPFTGGSYDLGVVDSGVQEDHPGFSNVDAFYSNFVGTDQAGTGHGTHVTGIVANNNNLYIYGGPYTGTATDLDAIVWGQSSNTQATTMARMDDLMTDFPQSPEVVNHSLGYNSTGGVPSGPVSTDDYVSNDSFYDAFVRNYDVQITKSAGNSGWGVNATMTFPANAHNIMVVANMDDLGTVTRSDDVRRTSSSVGPTANGRRKPDITAPGTLIQSTNAWHAGFGDTPLSGCSSTNNTDICTKSGTSMAAPHIAGAIVLQHDGGNLDAQAQKVVLLNTADWWTSNNTSGTGDDGEVTSQTCPGGFDPCETPWDRSYGWGYIDMSEALFNRGDYFIDSVVPRNDTAVEDDYELYKGMMFVDEKATLTWEKRHDTYVAGGASLGQRTLADINIRLYRNSDGALMDGDFVGDDNVHQVAADSSGTAVIKVYSWSTVFDGAASEFFWLATEENFVRTSPPSFSALPLIPVVGPFQTFTAPTQVGNNGPVGAHSTNVAIGNIAGVSGDGTSQNVGTIANGTTEQVDFTLTTTGISAGLKSIGVTVTSNSYDETYTGTFPRGLQFIVETTPPTSGCGPLPPVSNNPNINIPWSASDGFQGTGVAFAQLYVLLPGGGGLLFTGLRQNGVSGSFNYNMAAGDGAYRFAIRAQDNGGNLEAFPVATECFTVLDTAADSDGDSVDDSTDNCTNVFNPGQDDFNGDQIGDICDADVEGPAGDNAEDCFVNFLDLQRIKDAFFSNPASPQWDPEVDFDGSNLINFSDLQIMKDQFFGPPGPSANGCN